MNDMIKKRKMKQELLHHSTTKAEKHCSINARKPTRIVALANISPNKHTYTSSPTAKHLYTITS